jgi:hypothetical protein
LKIIILNQTTEINHTIKEEKLGSDYFLNMQYIPLPFPVNVNLKTTDLPSITCKA